MILIIKVKLIYNIVSARISFAKRGERQAESGGVRVPATAIVGGNLGYIDLAGSAQRNLGFTVGAKLPDQSKAAALFGQPIAQF